MKKKCNWIWYAIWGVIALVGGGGTLFSWMPRTPGMFYGGCAMLAVSAFLGTALVLRARGAAWKNACLRGAVVTAIYAVFVAATVYLCDKVIFPDSVADYQPVHSSIIVVIANAALALVMVGLVPKKYDPKLVWVKRIVALVLCGVALALSGLPQNWWWKIHKYKVASMKREAAPIGLSVYTPKETDLVEDADFYVSEAGSDENDGSFEKPFATLEKARDAVRALDKTGRTGITVAVMAGEYRISSLVFTEEDSGTETCPITYCAYGDGEVILNAGVSLNPGDFAAVTGAQADRIAPSARKQVVCVDLSKYGITFADYGNLHAIGAYSTAYKYDGDYTGDANCELYVDNVLQIIARYPNEGWLKTGQVLEHGQPYESNENPHVKVEGWDELRNPRGETYTVDKKLADRINGWAELDTVWMFGYFTADWAPSSTVIGNFDYENKTLQNKFVARYDTTDLHANYYFYNVLEELDAEGEWYLDRANGVLYMYRTENFDSARISLSLSTQVALTVENADWLTFRGFAVEGTRNDAIHLYGDHNTVESCLIHNVAGKGIDVDGYNNLIADNEITQVGSTAIRVNGGDRETLTPGNNRVYNNLIHDWTGGNNVSGVRLDGVGQHVDHNEFFNSNDSAIDYDGNNHIIEYNLIYDMSLEASDAGAIYSGRSWSDYGCIVRYNAIYNMGKSGFSQPNGIYLDDGLAGQQIYGNLLVNVPQAGIKLGGGRDNEIWGNILVNTTDNGIQGLEGVYYGSMSANIWDSLKPEWENSPKDTPIWQEAYPELAKTFWDETKQDDPYFVANAANNRVTGNILVNLKGELGEINGKLRQLSDVSGNAVYTMDALKDIFVAPEKGDYRLKEDSVIYTVIPDFEQLPLEKMGRE